MTLRLARFCFQNIPLNFARRTYRFDVKSVSCELRLDQIPAVVIGLADAPILQSAGTVGSTSLDSKPAFQREAE